AADADLAALLSLEGARQVLWRIGGHVFYLTVGSVGLVWLGLGALVRGARRVPDGEPDRTAAPAPLFRSALIFVGASLLGTLLLSVAWFTAAGGTRLDHWMYGRYMESVLPVPLLLGALSLDRAASWRAIAAIVAVAGLGAALLDLGLRRHEPLFAV